MYDSRILDFANASVAVLVAVKVHIRGLAVTAFFPLAVPENAHVDFPCTLVYCGLFVGGGGVAHLEGGQHT